MDASLKCSSLSISKLIEIQIPVVVNNFSTLEITNRKDSNGSHGSDNIQSITPLSIIKSNFFCG